MKTFKQVKFVEELLWRLARIQADAIETKFLVIEILSNQTGKPVKEIEKKWKSDSHKKAREIYLKSMKDVGLADDSDTIEN